MAGFYTSTKKMRAWKAFLAEKQSDFDQWSASKTTEDINKLVISSPPTVFRGLSLTRLRLPTYGPWGQHHGVPRIHFWESNEKYMYGRPTNHACCTHPDPDRCCKGHLSYTIA
ncbi:predicted protein [Coccidioides posadasii str. Silveira]|uniref:Predicted protein n=2 Tax=Coccidioides posadasii TaxID=199306 RepID=E9D6Z5_COCPS|nr:predicted protein [Coccidioides posadasii str. Silveira]KMM68720.1 hypothetical protein CPAG_05045 [Coccidioides posadasii RMSCC 3488]